ncbi:MAG TPA: SulP family inorganic anion transporter [Hydrogenophaga sp.]|uniref:SulP family inorganic anion transporter n=1 Tax=Hydrogenophaga sp. TaxID=1904254 RepID=UPI002BF3D2E3|nr:SulP family inorganic anion transporter [Hydrogenophaga sp.]HMN91878.1 SulP family inorganic anion transporter [Hydrogenophaga sp.]HMP08982.1 SulP family inorganic anion transporter [Hydrogenophaga sp.]
MKPFYGLHFNNLRGDLFGGVTAAIVALPLALAFGVASGAGPIAGLYGAIFVGFFAALFGGTPAQVSGPTGPMTVIAASVIAQYAHSPAMAFTVIMMAGAFMILFGVLRLGQYIRLVPYPVISGFMSGIGCIIVIIQLGPFLGHIGQGGNPLAAIGRLPDQLSTFSLAALALGMLTLLIVYLTPPRINRLVPAPLVALFVCTLLGTFLLTGSPTIGEIPTGLPTPRLPTFDLASLPMMLNSALTLAALGAIDSLLTSLVADNITRTRHESNRELVGQGIGNMVAGLMGGLPGAGATMRTVVNVRAGGRTPLSGMIHALVLLGIVLGLGGLAEYIPHAVLAGILLKVGTDIIDWNYIRRLRHAPRGEVVLMFTVLALTVLVDLITAVAVGVVMASLQFVQMMSVLQQKSIVGVRVGGDAQAAGFGPEEQGLIEGSKGQIVVFRLSGPMSFGAAQSMSRTLSITESFKVMVLDLSDVPLLDGSAAMAIEEIVDHARGSGADVFLVGLQPSVGRMLNRHGVLRKLGPRHRFRHLVTALRHAGVLMAELERDGH